MCWVANTPSTRSHGEFSSDIYWNSKTSCVFVKRIFWRSVILLQYGHLAISPVLKAWCWASAPCMLMLVKYSDLYVFFSFYLCVFACSRLSQVIPPALCRVAGGLQFSKMYIPSSRGRSRRMLPSNTGVEVYLSRDASSISARTPWATSPLKDSVKAECTRRRVTIM